MAANRPHKETRLTKNQLVTSTADKKKAIKKMHEKNLQRKQIQSNTPRCRMKKRGDNDRRTRKKRFARTAIQPY